MCNVLLVNVRVDGVIGVFHLRRDKLCESAEIVFFFLSTNGFFLLAWPVIQIFRFDFPI